jgi:hypothetical protein
MDKNIGLRSHYFSASLNVRNLALTEDWVSHSSISGQILSWNLKSLRARLRDSASLDHFLKCFETMQISDPVDENLAANDDFS